MFFEFISGCGPVDTGGHKIMVHVAQHAHNLSGQRFVQNSDRFVYISLVALRDRAFFHFLFGAAAHLLHVFDELWHRTPLGNMRSGNLCKIVAFAWKMPAIKRPHPRRDAAKRCGRPALNHRCYGVMRRAIILKLLPVQNNSPLTRRVFVLLIVPNLLSVPGCWKTCTTVGDKVPTSREVVGKVRSNVAAPPVPAVKLLTTPVMACCSSFILSAGMVPLISGTLPGLSIEMRCPVRRVVASNGNVVLGTARPVKSILSWLCHRFSRSGLPYWLHWSARQRTGWYCQWQIQAGSRLAPRSK